MILAGSIFRIYDDLQLLLTLLEKEHKPTILFFVGVTNVRNRMPPKYLILYVLNEYLGVITMLACCNNEKAR